MKRWISLLLAMAMLLAVMTACGGDEEEEVQEADRLRVSATAAQTNLDPLALRANGGDTLTYHLYENLMRWEDDGTGHAKLGYGAAESYTVEEAVDGSVTYTFTIRKDAKWSDGKRVTAQHFLYAWQRLFEMEEQPAELGMICMVEGYYAARDAKDGSLLTGVSAPNKTTLVIKLTNHCAYFLDEFCAGTLTMPVREDVIEDHGVAWGLAAENVISNGAYRVKAMDSGSVLVTRNEHYWQESESGPGEILFNWKTDAATEYEQLQNGELAFMTELPAAVVEEAAQAGTLTVEPVASTAALLMNNMAAPFDNEFVRQAFALAVDPQKMVEELGLTTAHAATGFVPHGIANRDSEWTVEDSEEIVADGSGVVLPEDLVEGAGQEAEKEEPVFWDYRAVGDYGKTEEELSDETRAARARSYLSQAGYPNGNGFPVLEYVYVNTAENTEIAIYLREVFRSILNVEIVFEAMTEEEVRARLLSGEFTLAAFRFDAAFDDALAFLQRWQSSLGTAGGNVVGFSDRAYDLLLSVVSASTDSAREACLHDAEELLMNSKGVVPMYYYGTTSQLAEGLTGLYRHAAQGVYFFGSVEVAAEEEPPVTQ